MSKHMRAAVPSREAKGRGTSRGSGNPGKGPGRSRVRHVKAVIVSVLVLLLVGICGAGALFAMSARSVRSEASEAASEAEAFTQAFTSGDQDGLSQVYGELKDTVAHIAKTTSGPLWTLASCVPVVGGDVRIVRELADVASTLVDGALGPMSEGIGEVRIVDLVADHTVDLTLIERASSLAKQTSPVVHEARQRVDSLTGGQLATVMLLFDTILASRRKDGCASSVQVVKCLCPRLAHTI